MINVSFLVFDYGDRRALDNVTLQVPAGSITALVGPNGAGKTTLMRCIAALSRPLEGTVHVAGLDVHAHPRDAHRLMGYLPDFFGLYDELTVRRSLDYRAAAQGIGGRDRAGLVRRAAERVGLDARLGDRVGTLSRGLRQRLAIAQAIVHEPRVLILDEPASGLDPEARLALSALLRTLRDEGMTLLVSSHILAELEDYSTHMCMMRGGRIIEFRPVNGGAEDPMIVTIELSAPWEGLDALLAGLPEVTVLAVTPLRSRIAVAADPEMRGALLRHLVQIGVPVTAFAVEKVRMQDAYMARAGER